MSAIPAPVYPLVYALVLFINGVLVVSVQPVVGKVVLPRLGGTPDIWNGCMFFFGMVTVAAYFYAQLTVRPRGLRWQVLLHLTLLALPVALAMVGVGGGKALLAGSHVPPQDTNVAFGVFALLLPVVGLPFFVIVANTLLLPRWFAETGYLGADDPYFLHAATGLGSLAGLVGYPILAEPWLGIRDGVKWWTMGYLGVVSLVVVCAALVWLVPRKTELPWVLGRPTMGRRCRWVIWSVLAGSLLLPAMARVTTTFDSLVPVWTAPSALYFAAVIAAFSRLLPPLALPAWVTIQVAGAIALFVFALLVLLSLMSALPAVACALLVVLLLCVPERLALVLLTLTGPLLCWILLTAGAAMPAVLLGVYLVFLYWALRVCFGQLVRDRPGPQFLTGFFLWILVGDQVAKLVDALPRALAGYQELFEYPLVVGMAWMLGTPGWPQVPWRSRFTPG